MNLYEIEFVKLVEVEEEKEDDQIGPESINARQGIKTYDKRRRLINLFRFN